MTGYKIKLMANNTKPALRKKKISAIGARTEEKQRLANYLTSVGTQYDLWLKREESKQETIKPNQIHHRNNQAKITDWEKPKSLFTGMEIKPKRLFGNFGKENSVSPDYLTGHCRKSASMRKKDLWRDSKRDEM